MSRPLVTFVLVSYNQEQFIREAGRGALAQTYSPLEIIFSDDCSQDRTFEIIQEEVAKYEGPHRILLNRNDQNRGIAGNVNRAMEQARGELIVIAAGDDISFPTRTEELVRVWENNRKACSVYSNVMIVDENGVNKGPLNKRAEAFPPPTLSWQEMVKSGHTGLIGCSHAWDRTVFDTFGPLPEDVALEDYLIPYRSALLGEVAYLDKCLVKWRRHGTNAWKGHDNVLQMSLSQYIDHQILVAKRYRAGCEGWLRDTRLFLSIHPETKAELQAAAEVIAARAELCKFKEIVVESDTVDRVRCCLRTLKLTRILGMSSMIKAWFLALSPTTYYKLRKWRDELVPNIHPAAK